uniref:Uncharacterized protein n=1 Tax=Timema monikensis TaxID=170555 RepID=A0A7R9DX21_9NEOP|nr:unnamed protein product [Timema monikensis]
MSTRYLRLDPDCPLPSGSCIGVCAAISVPGSPKKHFLEEAGVSEAQPDKVVAILADLGHPPSRGLDESLPDLLIAPLDYLNV